MYRPLLAACVLALFAACGAPGQPAQPTPDTAGGPAAAAPTAAAIAVAPANRSGAAPGVFVGPASGATAQPTPAQASTQPNVLLITIDTLRADHMSTYGGPAGTPAADRLAAEGVRFTNAYAQLPQTTPSHAALFTGQYPSTNGVRVSRHDRLPPESLTLAEVLADHGYRTGGLYSWYSLEGPLVGLDQGFATYRSIIVRAGMAEVLPPGAALEARDRGENLEAVFDGRADATTAAAIEWLDEAARDRARPWFLWVHYRDPHYPYQAPPPYDEMYEPRCPGCADGSFATLERIWAGWQPPPADLARITAAYDGEISFTDAEVARLLARLDQLGLAQATAVILTADHGEAFGEHGAWFHGLHLHQAETHVPLLVRWPGVLPAGATVDAAAQVVDVMPTVLDFLGLPLPPALDGRTLWPAMRGEDVGDYVAVVELAERRHTAVIQGEWKLVRDSATGQRSLYHLPTDPGEVRNRLSSDGAVAARLEAALNQWLRR
jgi:arylsulfatase A-like enzyme